VKLSQNPDVWVTNLLVAALKADPVFTSAQWIIAGDFNSCETFDRWRGGPQGNRQWLDRMATMGLIECLRFSRGALTPTYRHPRSLDPKSQIEYIFVSSKLSDRLLNCQTGDRDRVYNDKMSDHLPIIADFTNLDTP
jgi:endonuclease/exonuclease/phosphatase family metal-dependent hydrolase